MPITAGWPTSPGRTPRATCSRGNIRNIATGIMASRRPACRRSGFLPICKRTIRSATGRWAIGCPAAWPGSRSSWPRRRRFFPPIRRWCSWARNMASRPRFIISSAMKIRTSSSGCARDGGAILSPGGKSRPIREPKRPLRRRGSIVRCATSGDTPCCGAITASCSGCAARRRPSAARRASIRTSRATSSYKPCSGGRAVERSQTLLVLAFGQRPTSLAAGWLSSAGEFAAAGSWSKRFDSTAETWQDPTGGGQPSDAVAPDVWQPGQPLVVPPHSATLYVADA